MTIGIIGGGAAGMIAAITAAKCGGCVTLMERSARLGRKLAVTGNGRCNLTNLNMSPANFHGEAAEFAVPSIQTFGVTDTLTFFRSLGLVTVSEPSGRVYPHSDQAGSVVDVLRFAVEESGAQVKTSFEVRSVKRTDKGFAVSSADETLVFDKLIVTCGGIAGAKAGGTDMGYRILKSLGHSITALRPSLVQLKTENAFTRPLKGVRADAAVAVIKNGKVLGESVGEVQFTDYGISGPAVFEISRAAAENDGAAVHLDLMREMDETELISLMARRRNTTLTLENLLTGILHNKLGRTVITSCGYSLTAAVSSLKDADFERIVKKIKRCELKITGNMGMEGAQVTAGGIKTCEFDPETLESKIVPNLYAAGEVLDIDGDCGGYNLQWAWSSGRKAGLAAGESV